MSASSLKSEARTLRSFEMFGESDEPTLVFC
jgi:hypothetical protein